MGSTLDDHAKDPHHRRDNRQDQRTLDLNIRRGFFGAGSPLLLGAP
jgi:hypothetical protein